MQHSKTQIRYKKFHICIWSLVLCLLFVTTSWASQLNIYSFNPVKVREVNPNHLLQMYHYDCHLSFRNVTVMKSSASCVSVTVVSLLPYSASPYSESRFCFCQAFRAAPALLQVWLLTQASTRLQRCFWCFQAPWREGLECVPPHCHDDSVVLITGSFP